MARCVPISGSRLGRAFERFALGLVLLCLSTGLLVAQVGGADNDGDEARFDALLSTPNAYTPTPEDNLFATTPGLEQQAPRAHFTANVLGPVTFTSNAEEASSGGSNSADARPLVGISWATPVADLPLRFSANMRAEFERYPNAPDANVDRLRPTARLQYVDPDNDQAYSPYFAYVSRVDFVPTFASEFATRHDFNFGLNKAFNFDGAFDRVAFSGNSSADTVWSFGVTVFFQKRIRNLGADSYAGFFIPSVSYVISPQWNVSAGSELEYRPFESVGGFDRRDWFIAPIATLEYAFPSAWFGDRNAVLLGRPALDIQVAYERSWSNLDAANFTAWYPGAALKLGWRF